MKIMIIGANGQLGSDLVKVFENEQIIPLTHQHIEITDITSIKRNFEIHTPDLVINTAAYHKVPDCEKNPEKAFQVNAIGAMNLANICKENNTCLVHISTDYVFNGRKKSPYIETDLPNPLNTYGISKVAGEYFIQYILDKYFIVRTSGLYGLNPCRAKGRNFIDLMLKLAKERDEIKVVNDEVLTPTYTLDLANQIKELIKTDYYGLYHVTSNGQCSWYTFAKEIFAILKTNVKIIPVTSKEFPSSVKRPLYSVLENRALRKLGIDKMRFWKESLKDYLKERQNNV